MASPFWHWNYEKARVGVRAAEKAGIIYEVGKVKVKEVGSKAEAIFVATGLKVKRDWVEHDFRLHYWAWKNPNATFRLGYDCDPEFRADGEVTFSNGREGVLEMDMGTESLTEVLKRLLIHKGHEKFIFFIAMNYPRIEKLKIRIDDEEIAGRIWFANWYDLIKRPTVFQDIDGEWRRVAPEGG